MYVLLTDETNQQPDTNVHFFIYGGIYLHVEVLGPLHDLVERARSNAQFLRGDELKFDTRSRPQRVTSEAHTEAKRMVLEGCAQLGVRFLASVVLHDIATNLTPARRIDHGANTVIAAFHQFLQRKGTDGLCVMDRLPSDPYPYLRNKFEVGLTLDNGGPLPLRDRIRLFAFSCSGASHAFSAADIVLGAFRYCVNVRERRPACEAMWPHIAKMTERVAAGGATDAQDSGLLFRPMTIKSDRYRAEYEGLSTHLDGLLNAAKGE